MFETGLHELVSDDEFDIRGRGHVYTFGNDKMPEGMRHPNEFYHRYVMINGKRWYIIGVETAGTSDPYTGAFGLLVREP